MMNLPNLSSNYLPSANWERLSFKNPETEHEIAYAQMISPDNQKNLLILPGLSEFCEKYIESATLFYKEGYNIFIIDWAYQGRSTRLKENRDKRHSDGYQSDLSDLHFFITTFIGKQNSLFILAHSMGGHIAMRYMIEYVHSIKAASISAPMLKINSLQYGQKLYLKILDCLPFIDKFYVPKGKDWSRNSRALMSDGNFSSDPIRGNIHRDWSRAEKQLRLGSPTFKWLKESLKSMLKLQNSYEEISTPLLVGIAENETIVDNNEVEKAATKIKGIKLITLQNSKHEILMEKDEIRDIFLDETLQLFNDF